MITPTSPFESYLSLTNEPLTPLKSNKGSSRLNKWDPKPIEEAPAKQEALNCISLRDPLRARLLGRYNDKLKADGCDPMNWHSKSPIPIKKRELQLLRDPVQLAESYSDLICHHVAMRVALFFQQAIVCYKTPFHYEVGDTEGQIFEAITLKAATKSGATVEVKYQAAHSSTIPSLKACPISDYQRAQAKNKAPKYFSFLEGSYMENLDNSTVGLPVFVNQVDTLIDGNSRNKDALRLDTIALINQLALDQITPCDATREFLAKFLRQLDERPSKSKTLTDAKRKTISIYKEKVREMILLAGSTQGRDKENAFFDSLLSVNISAEKDEDIPMLRKIVYVRKFEIIREAQFAEGKIQDAIDKYFPQAVKQADKHAVRLCLASRVKKDPTLKDPLQSLFAVSIAGIQEDRNLRRELKQKYRDNQASYDNALRKVRLIVRGFQKLEKGFQAMLLRDFRIKLRKMTQAELSLAVSETINNEVKREKAKDAPDRRKIMELQAMPTSPSTISRLENSRLHINKDYKTPDNQRRKDLTLYHAQIISQALKIDPGHYFCSFFASAAIV